MKSRLMVVHNSQGSVGRIGCSSGSPKNIEDFERIERLVEDKYGYKNVIITNIIEFRKWWQFWR